MKKYVRMSLTVWLCMAVVACKTAQLTSQKYEGRATTMQRADSIAERDSVIILIQDRKDTVRIVKREVKLKERVVRQHDTLTIVKTDTVVKTVEPMIRSPASPLSTLKTWLHVVLTAIGIIIIITTIIKIKQLWDRLI